MGSEEGTTNDKSLFGLVRWQSVRVVPLDWLEDGHNLQYEKLPVRCRCKWGPADQVVELIEISDSKNALDEKMSKGHEQFIGTNTTDDHTIKTTTTTTTTDENGKVRKRQFSRDHVQTTDVKRTRISTEVNTTSPYQSPVQTLINVGYGMDSRDFPDTTSTASEDRQKVLLLTKQLEVEKQQKMEMIAMIQQLTTEVNMKRIELKEAKLRLQILESFPRPTDTQLSFLSELMTFYSHTSKQVAPKQRASRSLSEVSEKADHRDNGVHAVSEQSRMMNRSVIVSSNNNKHMIDVTQPQQPVVVASKVPEVTTITSAEGCYILAPTAFPPHAIRMVTMPRINSPGASSNGSRDGDEEVGSAGSSELGNQGVDIYGTPYGRNGYSGLVTQDEKLQEEEAFKPGPNKVELMPNTGVYIKISDLNAIEQTPKESPTALMRSLISTWYSGRLLASCSATKGISPDIKSAVFDYVKRAFPDAEYTSLQRALTSKCCEERRKIKKEFNVTSSPLMVPNTSNTIVAVNNTTYT